jgi:hypothetical protein
MSKLSEMNRRQFIWLTGVGAAAVGATSFTSSAFGADSDDPAAIAQDAYIWGFPLVLMEWYFESARQSNIPVNQFFAKQHLATPADKTAGPNIDTLYGYAWLDLSDGPQLLHVPDAHDRYYSIQFLDAYANTFAYVGRRATGTKEGTYAIVGPNWKGTLPVGVGRIDAPTNLAIAFTRTLVTSEADLGAAKAIHVQYALAPLSAYPKIQPPAAVADANLSLFPLPHFGTLGMDFFDKLAAGLETAPPPAYDLESLNRFAKVGIKPGSRPSQIKDEKIISVLREAVPAADARIKKANYSTTVNGWSGNTKVTNFIKDPFFEPP